MSVPVVGTLLATLIFGLVIPYHAQVQPCQLLKEWFVTPMTDFIIDEVKPGLRGISVGVPHGDKLCNSCGGGWDRSDTCYYRWRPVVDSPELFDIHESCVVGYSTLFGADFHTLASVERLWKLYGSMLEKSRPSVAFSLKKLLEELSALCNLPLPAGYIPVTRQPAPLSKRARVR